MFKKNKKKEVITEPKYLKYEIISPENFHILEISNAFIDKNKETIYWALKKGDLEIVITNKQIFESYYSVDDFNRRNLKTRHYNFKDFNIINVYTKYVTNKSKHIVLEIYLSEKDRFSKASNCWIYVDINSSNLNHIKNIYNSLLEIKNINNDMTKSALNKKKSIEIAKNSSSTEDYELKKFENIARFTYKYLEEMNEEYYRNDYKEVFEKYFVLNEKNI